MARRPTGFEVLEQARKQLIKARTLEELRSAQAVVFPLSFGMSMEDTGKALGISKGWACQLRREFIARQLQVQRGEKLPEVSKRIKRTNAYMSSEEEAVFLAQFAGKAAGAGVLIVSEIRQALEKKLGHKVACATTCNLLHRHNWRKLAPDKRHPKTDVPAQEDWKKNSGQRSRKSTKTGRVKEKERSV